jgi:hypothetical protein
MRARRRCARASRCIASNVALRMPHEASAAPSATAIDAPTRGADANHSTPIRTFLIGLGLSMPLRGRFR